MEPWWDSCHTHGPPKREMVCWIWGGAQASVFGKSPLALLVGGEARGPLLYKPTRCGVWVRGAGVGQQRQAAGRPQGAALNWTVTFLLWASVSLPGKWRIPPIFQVRWVQEVKYSARSESSIKSGYYQFYVSSYFALFVGAISKFFR